MASALWPLRRRSLAPRRRAGCRSQVGRALRWALAFVLGTAPVTSTAAVGGSYTLFESGQVRPLALSDDGSRLYAVNTPDDRLEVFDVRGHRLVHAASVPVGLEPVAVAIHDRREVWVVNHLSDSVSIVDLQGPSPRVTRTLLVGDEPNDIVFAGPHRGRAFVTTAHRGQNSPFPRSEYDRPGVGRADVWVFDADDPGASLGGDPISVVSLFGDKPRALAVSPDGNTVYAAVFKSGNRTTAVSPSLVCPGGAGAGPCTVAGTTYPGGLPAPNSNHEGVPAPPAGLIVKYAPASGQWLDELGRDWSPAVRFDLPDLDVFALDASATPPGEKAAYASVGTVLFDLAVNPVSGTLYVSNTEAMNEVRFEGSGILASTVKPPGEPASVRGHLHEARITVIDDGGVRPRHLNKHIPYGLSPVPAGVKERSLSMPLGMAVSDDGATLYVAAFGSGVVGVFDTAALESDTFVPSAANHIAVGGGPSGLALDDRRHRLYVLTRFDDSIVVVDTRRRRAVDRVALYDPEPADVVAGRPFLYDARLTSSNGESSCGNCHVFGDTDDLAWDLGNPDADVAPNPNPGGEGVPFHPIKGPMTTQTIRGLDHHGPMHWRGDRTGGNAVPPGDPLDESLAFEAFDAAFDSLLGRDEGPLSAAQMQAFADFALQITPPPNPIRRLDDSLREDEARGKEIFTSTSTFQTDPNFHCIDCHDLDPAAGHFGASGASTSRPMKIAQLRSAYQKIGMFGLPAIPLLLDPNTGDQGPQVRGFGFRHDGSIDTLYRFLGQLNFLLTPERRADLQAFLLAFPSNLAPIVGQQVTLRWDNAEVAGPRVDLLIERARTPFAMVDRPDASECDLVVKGGSAWSQRGWLLTPAGTFRSDRSGEPELSPDALRALAERPGRALTFTCAPPGSGVRMALDRDGDGALDGDERDAHSDPADPSSRPGAADVGAHRRHHRR